MVDLYLDDMRLTEIQSKDNHDLRFLDVNEATLHLVLSSTELLNLLDRVRQRCETYDLIYPVNIKRKEAPHEQ